MPHASCPDCRLRFTGAAVYLPACPKCGHALQTSAAGAPPVGYKLFTPEDAPQSLPEAIAIAMPAPDPRAGGS
jgi:hypothetical protein